MNNLILGKQHNKFIDTQSSRNKSKIIKFLAKKENNKVKPFIKWVGGKSALLEDIRQFYPKELGKKINKYCEPFIGGGALLFDILSNYDMNEIYISDVNEELINVYKTIKNDVEKLIDLLEDIQCEYIPLGIEARRKYYYNKRDDFNLYIKKEIKDTIYGSALFIFLNRTCFNGLYRVNRNGLFNVPMGSYKNPKICDRENLKNISEKLKNIKIVCDKYSKSFDFIDENTLVYFDPPYKPLTETASFTSYSKYEFGDKEQSELAAYFKKVSEKGATCILSNSDPKNIDKKNNFFDDLYAEFNINRIKSKRRINSNAAKRGNINELLITNIKGENYDQRW